MQTSSATIHTAPKDSATVIILRDSPGGPEVFLVRRHGLSDVLGGAHVFPGGKLDASDMQLKADVYLDQTLAQMHAALAEPQLDMAHGAGLYVAALREAFEECGVLFAQDATASQARQLAALTQAGLPFNLALAELGLRLRSSALLPWSRWITPVSPMQPGKRFDTRFFAAALPTGQDAVHDNVETTESVWLRPRAALEQYWDGAMQLAPPQIMTLAHLAHYPDVASVLQARSNTPPPLVFPEAFEDQGERVVCYPGDVRHSVPMRVMPGPTRLRIRNKRFEPDEGFGALFDLR